MTLDMTLAVTEALNPNKEKFKKNTLFRGALDWNALDIYTRNIDSRFSFKKKQKEWALLQNEMPQ